MTETPKVKIEQLKDPAFKYPKPEDIVCVFTGRVWLPGGMELGLTVKEAMKNAAQWWQNYARFTMPDYNKSSEYLEQAGMNSGILQGKAWTDLIQGEQLFVMWTWHSKIAFPQIEAGGNIADIKTPEIIQ